MFTNKVAEFKEDSQRRPLRTDDRDAPTTPIHRFQFFDQVADALVALLAQMFSLLPTSFTSPIPFISPGAIIVKLAFLVRITQTLFQLFFCLVQISRSIDFFVGLGAVVIHQMYLACDSLLGGRLSRALGDDPFDSASDLYKLRDNVVPSQPLKITEQSKRLHAMRYARGAYGNGPVSLMFDPQPVYNDFFFGNILSFIEFVLDSVDPRFHKRYFKYTIPNSWMVNSKHRRTFEPQFGFVTYFVQPTNEKRCTPIFTPLAGLYSDYSFKEGQETLFLVVRGSTTMEDWLVDFNMDPQPVQNLNLFGQSPDSKYDCSRDYEVHIGIFAAAYKLFLSSRDVIDQIHSERPEINTLVITGHSLGGGVAVYLVDLFTHFYKCRASAQMDEEESKEKADKPLLTVQGYAFAPPGCYSGDEDRKKLKNLTSFIFEDDIVPRLSLGSILRLLVTIANRGLDSHQMDHLPEQQLPETLFVPNAHVMHANGEIEEVVDAKKQIEFHIDPFRKGLVQAVKCHFPWWYDRALRENIIADNLCV